VAGVLPAEGYVLGSDGCGIRPRLKAIKDGYTNYWAEFLVARNSKLETLDDLSGKSWAHPEPPSASGWLVPSGMLAASDVEPGRTAVVQSHRRAVLAVYNGAVAFGTTWYLPPIDAAGSDLWDGTVENADVPEDLIASCAGSQGGDLFCGGNYEVRDARRTIAGEHPDVVQKVKILTLSDPIPNDTLAFSPDFPSEIQEAIVQAIRDLSQANPRRFAKVFAAYSWSGVVDTNDAEFESARQLVNMLGLSQEDLS
jgi:phosphonate transport system substrate-binding protein